MLRTFAGSTGPMGTLHPHVLLLCCLSYSQSSNMRMTYYLITVGGETGLLTGGLNGKMADMQPNASKLGTEHSDPTSHGPAPVWSRVPWNAVAPPDSESSYMRLQSYLSSDRVKLLET